MSEPTNKDIAHQPGTRAGGGRLVRRTFVIALVLVSSGLLVSGAVELLGFIPQTETREVRHVNDVLEELSRTWQLYEDLRLDSGSLDERARLTSVLHELRAEAALARSSSGRP